MPHLWYFVCEADTIFAVCKIPHQSYFWYLEVCQSLWHNLKRLKNHKIGLSRHQDFSTTLQGENSINFLSLRDGIFNVSILIIRLTYTISIDLKLLLLSKTIKISTS